MARFLTTLDGRWLDDNRFELLAPLAYESDVLGVTVTVPEGFVTDFASVPRVPVVYLFFGDRAHHESVIHDFLYQTHKVHVPTGAWVGMMSVERGTADKVFLEAMESRGKSRFVRYGMYWGVVLGGKSSYESGPSRYKVLNEK